MFTFPDHALALLINTDGAPRQCDIQLNLQGKTWLLKPETGESQPLPETPRNLCFAPWETLALWIDMEVK